MKAILKVVLFVIVGLGLILFAMSIAGVYMMTGKHKAEIPLADARSGLSDYLDFKFGFPLAPTDQVEHAYQMAGRDGPSLYLVRTSPERVKAIRAGIIDGRWPPPGRVEPYKEKTVQEMGDSMRWREIHSDFPDWWRADDLPDRNDLAVTWNNPDSRGFGTHGVTFSLSEKMGLVYVYKWST